MEDVSYIVTTEDGESTTVVDVQAYADDLASQSDLPISADQIQELLEIPYAFEKTFNIKVEKVIPSEWIPEAYAEWLHQTKVLEERGKFIKATVVAYLNTLRSFDQFFAKAESIKPNYAKQWAAAAKLQDLEKRLAEFMSEANKDETARKQKVPFTNAIRKKLQDTKTTDAAITKAFASVGIDVKTWEGATASTKTGTSTSIENIRKSLTVRTQLQQELDLAAIQKLAKALGAEVAQ